MYAVIDGGVPPVGRVRVSGAKNSATRLLAAALLTDDSVELSNFPTRLVDVGHKVKFCRDIGAEVTMDDVAETITIDSASTPVALTFPRSVRRTYPNDLPPRRWTTHPVGHRAHPLPGRLPDRPWQRWRPWL